MKRGLLLVLILVLALPVNSFAFQNEPDGFRGVKWGDPPRWDMSQLLSSNPGSDSQTYKISSGENLQIGGAELESIEYNFYKREFLGVLIVTKLWERERNHAESLKDVVELKFGLGEKYSDFTTVRNSNITKYRWTGDKATINLVMEGVRAELEIYSTETWEEKEEDLSVKSEEAKRKKEEERWRVAKEGLDDFSQPEEEQMTELVLLEREKTELERRMMEESDLEEQVRKLILLEKKIAELKQEIMEESGVDEGLEGSGQGSEIEGAITGRAILRWLQPPFPWLAEQLGIRDGKVRIKIWVLPSGEVVETMIIQTSNVPEFDQDASETLRKWRFESIEGEETQTGIVTMRFGAG